MSDTTHIRDSARYGTQADRRGRIAGAPLLVLLGLGLSSLSLACGSPAGTTPTTQVELGASPTIFGGAEDDDADANASVVALRVGSGQSFELCTGTLLAPNVVLTARHCVTENLTTTVSCDEDGNSVNGEHVAGDQVPSNISVYLGAKPSFGAAAAAVGRAVVTRPGAYLCDSDLALVVLDRDIPGVTPMAIRLGTPALAGEIVRSVGYGQNDDSLPIGTRFRKPGVKVLAQGKAVSASKTPLGPHEFEVGESICQGDSGGPAISEATGAVIGVVSRGGPCDADFGHIYTTTAGFDDLVSDAFQIAGGAPILETGTPAAAPATSSGANGDAQPLASSGCSAAPGPVDGRRSAGLLAFVALAVTLVRARRRA